MTQETVVVEVQKTSLWEKTKGFFKNVGEALLQMITSLGENIWKGFGLMWGMLAFLAIVMAMGGVKPVPTA